MRSRRRGSSALPVETFDTVLNRITARGSIVGTRKDVEEAIAFAAEGKSSRTSPWSRSSTYGYDSRNRHRLSRRVVQL